MPGIALPKFRRPADEEVEEIVLTAGSRDILRGSVRTSVVVAAIMVGAVVDVQVKANAFNAVVLDILLENVLRNVALVVVGIRNVLTVADLVTFHVIVQIPVQTSRNGVIIVSKLGTSVVNVHAVTAVIKRSIRRERRRHTFFSMRGG
uniref:Uncharacterized protein n=1 Tax=Onchocerca volvulus TaxID=6282 RepID=A0A2K6W5W8_ONCVO